MAEPVPEPQPAATANETPVVSADAFVAAAGRAELSQIPRWNRPAASGEPCDAGVVGARGLAADGDVILVAAELGDVALDPFQHGLLVENAVIGEEVAFVISAGCARKPMRFSRYSMVTTTVLPSAAILLPS